MRKGRLFAIFGGLVVVELTEISDDEMQPLKFGTLTKNMTAIPVYWSPTFGVWPMPSGQIIVTREVLNPDQV